MFQTNWNGADGMVSNGNNRFGEDVFEHDKWRFEYLDNSFTDTTTTTRWPANRQTVDTVTFDDIEQLSIRIAEHALEINGKLIDSLSALEIVVFGGHLFDSSIKQQTSLLNVYYFP